MNKFSKIYVAGHTGLLGSSILCQLEGEGYSCVTSKTRDELDLTDRYSVFKFFEKERPEYVFLTAGLTGGILANNTSPADFFHVNIAIQDNVFEAAQKYDVKNLVFYGSSCMYPKNGDFPMKEISLLRGEIEETSEAYALAKIAGVIACRAYNKQYKTKRFIALVPNSFFGPRGNFDPENSHVLSALIRNIHAAKKMKEETVTLWGSGEPRRELIFVDDVADASIFAVKNADKLSNRHYNIGSGVDYSIKELAQMIADMIGFRGHILWDKNKPDGALRKLLDSSDFTSFGWRPRTSLEEGIKKTYEWYGKNKT